MKHQLKIFILLLSTLHIGCSKNDTRSHESEFNYFLNNLDENSYSYQPVVESELNQLYSPANLVISSSEQLVINNAPGWEICLLDSKGEVLSIQGGTGRGVNKFDMINSLQINSEDYVYALDKKSHEVEIYSIENSDLKHKETVVLPNYSTKSIESIIFQDSVWYGVFREKRLNQTESTSENGFGFQLFELDNELLPQRLITEMPSNEIVGTIAEGIVQDNPFGYKTMWHFKGSTFLFANTAEFKITTLDLSNGERHEHAFNNIPERSATNPEKEFILEKFKIAIQFIPTFKEDIIERKNLPYFQNFGMNDSFAFFQILNYSNEPDKILKIDLKSDQKEIIEVSSTFSIKHITQDTIYGIDFDPVNSGPVKILLKD